MLKPKYIKTQIPAHYFSLKQHDNWFGNGRSSLAYTILSVWKSFSKRNWNATSSICLFQCVALYYVLLKWGCLYISGKIYRTMLMHCIEHGTMFQSPLCYVYESRSEFMANPFKIAPWLKSIVFQFRSLKLIRNSWNGDRQYA